MALAARIIYEDGKQERKHFRGARARRVRIRLAGRGTKTASIAAIPLALLLAYVWLTAQLTAQTYRLHDDQAAASVLVQQDNELRQQVAKLESLPRLEAAAAKLHMTVPPGVALVAPPFAAAAAPPRTVFAASLEDVRKWFGIR